jgi:hypothetical protein
MFQHQAMVAHEVAVVGGEDHDGVAVEPERAQLAEHAADRVVDHRDHAVGERDALAHRGLVGQREGRRPAGVRLAGGGRGAQLFLETGLVRVDVMEAFGQRDRRRIVHVEIAARRRERMMRVRKRALQKERLAA